MTSPVATPTLREDLRRVAAQIPPGSRVLDLGCGEGELLNWLITRRGCAGTGVERDPHAILAAVRAGVPTIDLDLDTELDEFAPDSYDVVVLSRTLQAVLRPDLALAQMASIGKRLIVTMPNFGFFRHRLSLLAGRMPSSKDLPFSWYETPNLHHTTLVELEQLFHTLGLHVEKRLPLDESGRALPLRHAAPNLRASSAIYVLSRPSYWPS